MALTEAFPAVSGNTTAIYDILRIGIILLSLFLLTLTITAYRNTKIKKTLLASAAFGIFAVQLIFNFIDAEVVDFIPDDIRYVILSFMTMVILLLFFLSIIKK